MSGKRVVVVEMDGDATQQKLVHELESRGFDVNAVHSTVRGWSRDSIYMDCTSDFSMGCRRCKAMHAGFSATYSGTESGYNGKEYFPPRDGDGSTKRVWDRSSMLKKLNDKAPWKRR